MINIASKAGNYIRATNQIVASGLKPLAGAALAEKKIVVEDRELSTVYSLSKNLPAGNINVKAGLTSELNINLGTNSALLDVFGPNFCVNEKLYNQIETTSK
jgi:Ubiquinol-cytochrome c reductase 8 kDa, N-terminal